MGDIFVCASTSETQGLTYVEALANRLPCVCRFDTCLENVIINERNGYLYNSYEEFYKYVLNLLNNESLRKKMKSYSRSKAMEFDSGFIAEKIEKVYAA